MKKKTVLRIKKNYKIHIILIHYTLINLTHNISARFIHYQIFSSVQIIIYTVNQYRKNTVTIIIYTFLLNTQTLQYLRN